MKNTVQNIIDFILDALWVATSLWLCVNPLVFMLPWVVVTTLLFVNANRKQRGKYD